MLARQCVGSFLFIITTWRSIHSFTHSNWNQIAWVQVASCGTLGDRHLCVFFPYLYYGNKTVGLLRRLNETEANTLSEEVNTLSEGNLLRVTGHLRLSCLGGPYFSWGPRWFQVCCRSSLRRGEAWSRHVPGSIGERISKNRKLEAKS